MQTLWQVVSYFTIFAVLIFCLDDLLIDFIALIFHLKPEATSIDQLAEMHNMPQKRIAIMIANWHEDDIIERMIHGNTGRIDYQNYDFFLGVYPNDIATVRAAQRLEEYYSNVYVVINPKDGPTSKGQMLNEIAHHISAKELLYKKIYDIYLLHDSEDIIHPLSLKLINYEMQNVDFLQTPVFSLPTKWNDIIRATYIDEFTESHTKDMLVRSFLKGGIPSAGVGTAMTRMFVSEIKLLQNNQLLKEDTLTEDYHLGLMAHRLDYISKFVCCFVQKKNRIDYIATREYFPSQTKTSIRQKSRWTLGISFQGFENLGWSKTLSENYFLWRDRRSILNASILILSYGLTLSYLGYYFIKGRWPDFLVNSSMVLTALTLNFYCMVIRLAQRFRLVHELNGLAITALLPIRWFVANYINTMATFNAYITYKNSKKFGIHVQWAKTAHELPRQFGVIKVPAILKIKQETQKTEQIYENET